MSKLPGTRAIVTGGAGFIGSHIVDALLGAECEVVVLDDFSTGRRDNLAAAVKSGRVKIHELDICSRDVVSVFEQFRPEIVFHLAAQMNVRRSVKEPLFDAQKNVLGTVNLLEAARLTGVKSFIFSSTGGAIYGEQETFPAPETHRVSPECPYGVSKRAGEIYLEYFSRVGNFAGIALRFANVFGPRQNAKGEAGVVAIFSERMIAGEPLVINGAGKQTRDFVYVGDVVAACMTAAAQLTRPGFSIYNVGCGRETSILELVKYMTKGWSDINSGELAKPVKVEHGPALPGEQHRSVVDPTKIAADLGWRPTVEITDGLRTTIKSFLA